MKIYFIYNLSLFKEYLYNVESSLKLKQNKMTYSKNGKSQDILNSNILNAQKSFQNLVP